MYNIFIYNATLYSLYYLIILIFFYSTGESLDKNICLGVQPLALSYASTQGFRLPKLSCLRIPLNQALALS